MAPDTTRAVALALLLLASGAAAAAEELGTLFTTVEERARLDRMRRGEAVEPGAPSAPRMRELTGYVKRSDGLGTLWIDGVPVPVATRRAAPVMDPAAVRETTSSPIRIERSKR